MMDFHYSRVVKEKTMPCVPTRFFLIAD